MSSYFDAKIREIKEKSPGRILLQVVAEVERTVWEDCCSFANDPEMPTDITDRMATLFGTQMVYEPRSKADTFFGQRSTTMEATGEAIHQVSRRGSSVLIESLHDLFHDLARRRIETRFGYLTDDPAAIRSRLEEHESP